MDGGQVIKLTEGGGLDRGFGNQGVVTWRCNKVNSASVDADGRVLVAGTSFTGGGSGDNNAFVARLDPDGRFDSGFGLDGQAVLHRSDTYYLDGVEALAQGVGVIAFGQNWTHDEKHLDLVRLFG
jgi:hypothetical protein